LRAAAELRWTGSWSTVFIFVERRRGLLVDDNFKTMIRTFVEQFRWRVMIWKLSARNLPRWKLRCSCA